MRPLDRRIGLGEIREPDITHRLPGGGIVHALDDRRLKLRVERDDGQGRRARHERVAFSAGDLAIHENAAVRCNSLHIDTSTPSVFGHDGKKTGKSMGVPRGRQGLESLCALGDFVLCYGIRSRIRQRVKARPTP